MRKLCDWFLKRRIVRFLLRKFKPYQEWTSDCEKAIYAAFRRVEPARLDQLIDELMKEKLFIIGPDISGNSGVLLECYKPDEKNMKAYLLAPYKKAADVLTKYWFIAVAALAGVLFLNWFGPR